MHLLGSVILAGPLLGGEAALCLPMNPVTDITDGEQ